MAKSELADAFDQLNKAITHVSKETLEEVGQFAITIITLRTKKGLDADREQFKPYTKAYARKRLNKGYSASPPDLTIKGHMLGSMLPVVTGDNEVTVAFGSPKEDAKARGNSHKREFFDVRADAELEAIADLFGDKLVAEIVK